MKCKVGEFYARAMAGFPRILFGRESLIKWLMYSPRKMLRGKLPVRYQGLTLRFAVNVDFFFLNKYLDYNNNNDFINVSSNNLAEGIPHC